MLYYNLGISDTKKQVSEPSYEEMSRVLEDKIKGNILGLSSSFSALILIFSVTEFPCI